MAQKLPKQEMGPMIPGAAWETGSELAEIETSLSHLRNLAEFLKSEIEDGRTAGEKFIEELRERADKPLSGEGLEGVVRQFIDETQRLLKEKHLSELQRIEQLISDLERLRQIYGSCLMRLEGPGGVGTPKEPNSSKAN